MPSLNFRLKKRSDGMAQLTLVREDGSVTTGGVGPADGYFPVHDLTHFAVEQTLGLSEGFLGLVASGWEITDFAVRGISKVFSPETVFAEEAAGEISRQLLMRQPSTLDELLWVLKVKPGERLPGSESLPLTEALVAAIRDRVNEEWRNWRELAAKGTLDLTFTSPRRANIAPPNADQRKRRSLAAI